MLSRDIGHGLAARHPSQLVDPLFAPDLGDPGSRASALRFLADDEVPVGESGDLGQMGDAQHLVLGCELGEDAPHPFGGRAPDPGVHLVEHDDHVPIRPAERVLDREEEPQELSPPLATFWIGRGASPVFAEKRN